jgi:LysR family nitrogen assimilation transcriptional regulator
LAVSPLCLVGPAGDRLSAREQIDFKKLDGIPVVMPMAGDAFRTSIADAADKVGVRLNVVAEIDSVHLMRDMVAAGVGYALLTTMSVANDLKAGRLSAARIINPEMQRSIYLIVAARKASSLATREVSRIIRQVAEELALEGLWGDRPASE